MDRGTLHELNPSGSVASETYEVFRFSERFLKNVQDRRGIPNIRIRRDSRLYLS
jgi:hypothetical protein